jgi:WD40 repeat protein
MIDRLRLCVIVFLLTNSFQIANSLAQVADGQMCDCSSKPLVRFGRMDWSAGDQIRSLAASSDGRCLALVARGGNADIDTVIQFFDSLSGKRISHFQEPNEEIVTAVCSSGAPSEFLIGTTGKVVLTGTHRGVSASIPVPIAIDGLCVDPGSTSQFLCWNDERIVLVDRKCGGHLSIGVDKGIVAAAAVYSPRDVIAAILIPNQLVLWDAKIGEERFRVTIPEGNYTSLSFSPDGSRLSVAGDSDTDKCHLFTIERVNERICLGKPRTLRGHTPVAFSPDGKWITIVVNSNSMEMHPISRDYTVLKSPHFGDTILALAFSYDGTRVFFGGSAGVIRSWEVRGTNKPAVAEEIAYAVTAATMSPTGGRLVVGRADDHIEFWDLSGGCRINRLKTGIGTPEALKYSDDGNHLAIGCSIAPRGDQSSLFVYSGGMMLPIGACKSSVYDLDFNQSKQLLAVVEGSRHPVMGRVRVLDFNSWRVVADVAAGAGHSPSSCSWSPNGDYLAVGCEDGSILIHDWSGRGCPFDVEDCEDDVRCLEFSNNGNLLLSGDADGTIRAWDIDAGRTAYLVESHGGGYVNDLEIAVSSDTFATCGTDGVVRVWAIRDGQLLSEFRGHWGDVRAVSILPDGSKVVSGGDDTTIAVWAVHEQELGE